MEYSLFLGAIILWLILTYGAGYAIGLTLVILRYERVNPVFSVKETRLIFGFMLICAFAVPASVLISGSCEISLVSAVGGFAIGVVHAGLKFAFEKHI